MFILWGNLIKILNFNTMTQSDFLKLYKTRYTKILDGYVKLVKDNLTLNYNDLFDKTVEYGGEISHKRNTLISELMNENGLDHTATERQGLDDVNIESAMFKKALSVVSKDDKNYDTTVNALLLEVRNRDFPMENGQ